MSFERMPSPAAGEPAPPASADIGQEGGGTPPAMQLQVLATEHWGLLATRSLAWNETFTRAGMFLSTLSGAIVALALVAQATAFGDGFFIFALVILPVVLFIGLTTVQRMGASNYYDAQCVIGMNRIRHAYLQLAPEVEPYLVMGSTDDEKSVAITMGRMPQNNFLVDIIVATPSVLAVINSVLAGAIVALIALQLDLVAWAAVVLGVGTGVIGLLLQFAYAARTVGRFIGSYEAKFPARSADPPAPPTEP